MDDHHHRSSPGTGPRRLVIQLARFGDLIQTKRLVLSLLAEGETHLLVDHSLVPLARLVYPGAVVHGIAAHGAHGPGILARVHADLAALAGLDFHQVYNLNFSGQSFALAGMFPAATVRGYRLQAGQRLIDSWPGLVMRWTRERVPASLNLVDVWALYADRPLPPPEVNPAAVGHGGGLGVVLAGQNARRSLPAAILAPLVQAARGRIGGGPILLLGSGGERRAAKELTALLPPSLRADVRDLVGRTGWGELHGLVGGLDLLLTPDTGSMHLAAHLGVPVLAFFLSSAWCHETGPYGAGHTVLQAATDCAPCLETAPCVHEIFCRRAFSDKATLRFVAGRTDGELAPGLLAMTGGFDDLGQTWTPLCGHDPHAGPRAAFRAMAAACAGAPLPGPLPAAEESWILERDWILPQTLRGHAHE